MQQVRGNQIAMIFQEPMTSLNPLYTCGNQVVEAILLHQRVTYKAAKQKTIELFEKVQLSDPAVIFNRFPHEISGGQKQRVMIAMAISCEPLLLIADEPTTALDVTVQKSILHLIKTLQAEKHIGVIFISHDLGLVAEIADRAIVMFRGKIVEQNTIRGLFSNPRHPYTRALLACRPSLHAKGDRLPVVGDFMEVDRDGTITEKARHPAMTVPVMNYGTLPERPRYGHGAKETEQQSGGASSLPVENLKVWFHQEKKPGQGKRYIKAVDDGVSGIRGETVGLVGESGCGKTTLGSILRWWNLLRAVRFNRQDLQTCLSPPTEMRKDLQIIFGIHILP